MYIIIDAFIFLLFFLVYILLTGVFLVKYCQIKTDKITFFTLSLALGLVLFTYLSFLIRLFQLPYELTIIIVYIFLLGFLSAKFPFKFKDLKFNIKKELVVFFMVVISLIILLVGYHLTSGFTKDGLSISAARDSLWRIAVTEELVNRFPPQHPGYPPQLLKNYHYFYDLLIASTYKMSKIPIIDLYYRYFPVLSAVVFILGAYSILTLVTKKYFFRIYGLILVVMTGNVSFILPFISKSFDFTTSPNVFMSDQPFDQSYNPFNLLAYGLFLICLYLLFLYRQSANLKVLLLTGLTIGILPGFKIYAGIVIFLGLGLFFLLDLIFSKKISWDFLISGLFFLPIYLVMRGDNPTGLVFAPFWLLTKMVSDSDRIYLPQMVLREQFYSANHNFLRLVQIKIEQLLIYLVGNWNVRILGVIWWVKNIPSSVYSIRLIVILVFISTLMPIIFTQTRAVYDIIQFFPYSLILLSLVSIFFIEKIFGYIRKSQRLVAYMFLLIIVLIALPTNFDLAISRFANAKETVNPDEVEALTYLHSISNADDIILSDLSNYRLGLMYIPAISGRRTFLSGEGLITQTGISTSERKNLISYYFNPYQSKNYRQFLLQNHIAYIYLPANSMFYTNLDNSVFPLVFQNKTVKIFKTKIEEGL